jgi:uncharacterized membrane protein
MSIHERKAIVSIIGTIIISIGYAAYMAQRYPFVDLYSPEVFRFWGAYFLILILVTIVAKIIIAIVFSILNTIATGEAEPSITDERDHLIDLKATRNGMWLFILGFVLAMVALVMGQPPAVMFLIILCGGMVSDLISDFSEFYFYRRGF